MILHRILAAAAALLGLAALAQPAFASECLLGAPGSTQRVQVGDSERAMSVHIPAGVSRTRNLPLVFLLHGSGGTGAAILDSSGLAATSDHHGFVLVAPDAGIPVDRGFVWNIPGVPTITGEVPGEGDADDVAFLTATIDRLAGLGCIDRDRVYVTGLSGGGRMTSWLGCVASDRFAAIAPVVGLRAGNPLGADPRLPDPATCAPERPVPVYAFAGADDTVNPVGGGGAGYWQYSMDAALARWARIGGCRDNSETVAVSDTVEERRYGGCKAGAQVIGRLVEGRGHEWVADNEAMWMFFWRHGR